MICMLTSDGCCRIFCQKFWLVTGSRGSCMYCILCMANIVDVYVYIVGAEKPRSIQCSPGKLKSSSSIHVRIWYDLNTTRLLSYMCSNFLNEKPHTLQGCVCRGSQVPNEHGGHHLRTDERLGFLGSWRLVGRDQHKVYSGRSSWINNGKGREAR